MCRKDGSERNQFLNLLLETIERVVPGSTNSRVSNPTRRRVEIVIQLRNLWSVWCVSCDNSTDCCITALVDGNEKIIRTFSESNVTDPEEFADYDS